MTNTRAALAILLAVVGLASAGLRAEIIEQILVKVNGEIFTKSDLEQRQVSALRQKGQQIDLKADSANQQLRKALDEITPQIMVDAVDEMLLVQRGKELGYKLSDEQFKGVLDNIKKENKLESEEQFQAALKAEGITMVDLRRNLERSMLVQRVQQNEVMGKIGVSEDEARKYYDSHLNEFTTPQSVTLREILVALPADNKGVNVAADEAAKAKAEAIRERATSGGESFEKLAADVSDAPSKANAGLIGPISMSDLSADLRKMIEALKAGDVTPVTRMARGYQLQARGAYDRADQAAFEQARDQIGDRVFTDKRKAEYQKYLENFAPGHHRVKNPDVKKAFEAGLKAQATVPSP
jgi:peptidyl-prolyl cis-trans isomerase SurA